MVEVAAIVLAAGRGTRFGHDAGESKLTVELRQKPMIRHVVETALASRAAPIVVVTGHAEAPVLDALSGLAFSVVRNADYANGMAGSLRLGVAELSVECDGALVMLADMPLVRATTLDAMIARFAEDDRVDAVVPVYNGAQGNPVLIGRALFAAIAKLSGDRGARSLLAQPGRRVATVSTADAGIIADVDTPEMLKSLATT